MEKKSKSDINVLISGKDFINLLFYANTLKAIGWNTNIAENEENIVKLFEQGMFDLIIIDFNLLTKYGFDAVKKIRTSEKTKKMKCIIIGLTEYMPKEDLKEFSKIGFDSYLLKPFDQDGLLKGLSDFFIIPPPKANPQSFELNHV